MVAVVFVVGLMNLTWMAVIAAIFLAEKTWRHGVTLIKVVGVAVVLLGLAVVARPSLVGDLSTVFRQQRRHVRRRPAPRSPGSSGREAQRLRLRLV